MVSVPGRQPSTPAARCLASSCSTEKPAERFLGSLCRLRRGVQAPHHALAVRTLRGAGRGTIPTKTSSRAPLCRIKTKKKSVWKQPGQPGCSAARVRPLNLLPPGDRGEAPTSFRGGRIRPPGRQLLLASARGWGAAVRGHLTVVLKANKKTPNGSFTRA